MIWIVVFGVCSLLWCSLVSLGTLQVCFLICCAHLACILLSLSQNVTACVSSLPSRDLEWNQHTAGLQLCAWWELSIQRNFQMKYHTDHIHAQSVAGSLHCGVLCNCPWSLHFVDQNMNWVWESWWGFKDFPKYRCLVYMVINTWLIHPYQVLWGKIPPLCDSCGLQ